MRTSIETKVFTLRGSLGAFMISAALVACNQGGSANDTSSTTSPDSAGASVVSVQVTPVQGGNTPEPPSVSVTPTRKAVDISQLSPAEAKIARRIDDVVDFLALYNLREHYTKSGELTDDLRALIADKENEIRKASPPQEINQSFELMAFDWQAGDVSQADKGDVKTVAKLLIRKTKPLELQAGQKVQLSLRFKPDPSHEGQLGKKQKGGVDFLVPTDAGDATWPVGETRLIRRNITLPVLPYNVFVWFSVYDENGVYVERLGGQKAGMLDLGWHAALPNETEEAARTDSSQNTSTKK